MRYIKSHNLADMEVLTQKQFTTQIKFKDYYCDYRSVRFLYEKQTKYAKAFVLNTKKLKNNIVVENLCQ